MTKEIYIKGKNPAWLDISIRYGYVTEGESLRALEKDEIFVQERSYMIMHCCKCGGPRTK